MVEGHQCHRVGAAHRLLLLGKAFTATSPNGRFADGAAAISGKPLKRIEVWGKNLFYFFGRSCDASTAAPAAAAAAAAAAPRFGASAAGALLAAGCSGSGAAAGAAAGGSWDATLLDLDPLAPAQEAESDSDSGGDAPAAAAATAAAVAAAAAAAAAEAPSTPAARRLRGRRGSGSGSSTVMQGGTGQLAVAAAAEAAGGDAAATAAGGSSSDEEDLVVVNIHFGMSGAFRTARLPGPAPTPTTRLRLEHSGSGIMAHLSAMTVVHGGLSLYHDKIAKLGPDPLRDDADPAAFCERVLRSRKPIGLLLMDQSAIAGVGNIYRAEVLFKSAIHPEQPGNSLSRAQVMEVWRHSSELLQRGFTSGSILTVDPAEAALLGKPWTRRFIYNQSQCGRCKGPIRTWDMAGRTVYCCTTCQPLRLAGSADAAAAAGGAAAAAAAAAGGGDVDKPVVLTPARLKSMASARVAKKFVSHCAPDEPEELPQKRQGKGGSARGQRKARTRPASAAAAAAAGGVAAKPEAADTSGSEDDVDRAEAVLGAALSGLPPATKQRARRSSRAAASTPDAPVTPALPPGSRRRGRAASLAGAPGAPGFASASAAAAEKAAAGESKAVEHVALVADEATEAIMFGQQAVQAGQQQDGGGGGGGGGVRAKRVRRV